MGRDLETMLRLPTTALYYHSVQTGFHAVAKGLVGANGIAGLRPITPTTSVAHSKNRLFVASSKQVLVSI
jgi:hypothetical protein